VHNNYKNHKQTLAISQQQNMMLLKIDGFEVNNKTYTSSSHNYLHVGLKFLAQNDLLLTVYDVGIGQIWLSIACWD